MFVMPGLVPGIHALLGAKAWMAGTSPAMTAESEAAYAGNALESGSRTPAGKRNLNPPENKLWDSSPLPFKLRPSILDGFGV
jgi:hypothetical protein